MSRTYRIWNKVTACIYKSSRSWGVRDTGKVEVLVGGSASNNEVLVNHSVTRRTIEKDGVPYESFRFYIDGQLYAQQIWSVNEKGTPTKLHSRWKARIDEETFGEIL